MAAFIRHDDPVRGRSTAGAAAIHALHVRPHHDGHQREELRQRRPHIQRRVHGRLDERGLLAVMATFFAIVRTWTRWCNLTRWNPTHLFIMGNQPGDVKVNTVKGVKYVELSLEEGSFPKVRPLESTYET